MAGARTTRRDRIVAWVTAAGGARQGQIAAAMGLTPARAGEDLAALVAKGRLCRPARGYYCAPGHVPDQIPPERHHAADRAAADPLNRLEKPMTSENGLRAAADRDEAFDGIYRIAVAAGLYEESWQDTSIGEVCDRIAAWCAARRADAGPLHHARPAGRTRVTLEVMPPDPTLPLTATRPYSEPQPAELAGYGPPPPPQPCPACGAPERAPHRPVPLMAYGGLAVTGRCPLSPGPRCPACGAPPGGRHGTCGYRPRQPDLTALARALIRGAQLAGAGQELLWRIAGLPDPREQVAVATRILTRLAAAPPPPPAVTSCGQP